MILCRNHSWDVNLIIKPKGLYSEGEWGLIIRGLFANEIWGEGG